MGSSKQRENYMCSSLYYGRYFAEIIGNLWRAVDRIDA